MRAQYSSFILGKCYLLIPQLDRGGKNRVVVMVNYRIKIPKVELKVELKFSFMA
jgi:hypothetical protein